MNTRDIERVRRIAVALNKAVDVFRNSTIRATVGDIEAENELTLLRDELESLLAREGPRPVHRPPAR